MAKHRVVIVGGGFGGVKTALELADDPRFHITLITDHLDFRYYPTLYRTATGGSKRISSIPLREIFAGKRVHLLQDEVVGIDRQARTVKTKIGHTVGYEAVVIGLGVRTNYFHIEGLPELSYGIKSVANAEALKAHLHQQLVADHKPDLNYVVIGGGPTGIELAGELPAYLKYITKQHGMPRRAIHVDLIEAAPRLLPRMPKDLSKRVARRLRKLGVRLYLSTTVQAQTADALMVGDKPIRSHTVIWTAGVANHPFFTEQAFQLAKNGKVRVDQYLQTETGIYVIGDNADTPFSGMAQTALYDGAFVAKNLKRLANKEEARPYVAKKPIYVFPAGPGWAAVLWGRIRIYGRLGWILRSLADLLAYHDYQPWRLASKLWIASGDTEETCPTCSQPQIND